MADSKEAAKADVSGAAPTKKNKKKLIIIVAAVALLVAGGGGAAAFMLIGKKKDETVKTAAAEHGDEEAAAETDDEGAAAPKDKKATPADAHDVAADAADEDEAAPKPKKKKKKPKGDPKHPPAFVDLEAFTVNLADTDEHRMMQVKMTLAMKNAEAGEFLKTLMPAVRNDILLLLGSKKAADIAPREGKEELADEIMAATNDLLRGSHAAKGVQAVHFQQLIVQ